MYERMEQQRVESRRRLPVPVQTQPAPVPAAAESPGQPLPPVAPFATAVPEARHENVLAGVVGAFLLALVGGALYFIIYQFGYIAGICLA